MSTKLILDVAELPPSPGLASRARATATRPPLASVCLLLSDFVALSLLFWMAVWSKYWFHHDLDLSVYVSLFPAVFIFLGVFFSQDLYPGTLLHPAEEMGRVFHGVTAVLLVLLSTIFLRKSGGEYSRSIFLVIWLLGTPTVLLCRSQLRRVLRRMSWWDVPVVLMGSSSATQQVARSLQSTRLGLKITGVLLDGPRGAWDDTLPPVIGTLSDGNAISRQGAVRYAILAMPNRSHEEVRKVIQDDCRSFHRILVVSDLPGICCLGISPREIGGQIGLEIPQRLRFVAPRLIKRCMDLAVSAVLLIALLPLLLLICAAIKLTSKGPILFGQIRYGRDGKAFRALKFRTMITNADKVLQDHLQRHPELLLEWKRDHKLKNDPRLISVGRLLRRYSLDELPQLINILTGHMSLVGPRPIVHSEIERYATSYDLYTRVPPGLTGLWQVSGRSNTTYTERVAFDEYYIRNWSVWLDMYILTCTFQAVVRAEGAY